MKHMQIMQELIFNIAREEYSNKASWKFFTAGKISKKNKSNK